MSESEQRSLQSMQTEVDDYIQQFKTGYFSPLGQMARLTEEVGELAREVNHYYGENRKADENQRQYQRNLEMSFCDD